MINAVDFFDDYMKMVAKKYRLNKADKHRVENAELYLKGIEDELQEVREEIKKDNYVYLEDELGDILWDYLNVLHALESEGFIRSWQDVLQRSFHKYNERVNGIEDGVIQDKIKGSWARVKARQKEERKREHQEAFGKNNE